MLGGGGVATTSASVIIGLIKGVYPLSQRSVQALVALSGGGVSHQ